MSMLRWYWPTDSEKRVEKPATHWDTPGDDLIESAPDRAAFQADCCIARAIYPVVLPPNDSLSRAAHLMWCAHHYRKCAAGLRRARPPLRPDRSTLVAARTGW
jgi:hypothetical protein